MNPLHFGDSARLLFGFHHPVVGASRRTAVLICSSWGPEYMRGYRGVRGLAQRLSAAGFETLRFDYSGTGDSLGHSLDARVEHWLADIALAAQELRDISGQSEIAVIGVRLGALLAEAARLEPGLRARLHVHWDAPESGADFVSLMKVLEQGTDTAKRWRRNRDMQLPPSEANELCGHAWPPELADAVKQLARPSTTTDAQLWFVSQDELAPSNTPVQSTLSSEEAAHWREIGWVHTPWNPVAASNRLIEHLLKVLP